jgi:hypothetical protein
MGSLSGSEPVKGRILPCASSSCTSEPEHPTTNAFETSSSAAPDRYRSERRQPHGLSPMDRASGRPLRGVPCG